MQSTSVGVVAGASPSVAAATVVGSRDVSGSLLVPQAGLSSPPAVGFILLRWSISNIMSLFSSFPLVRASRYGRHFLLPYLLVEFPTCSFPTQSARGLPSRVIYMGGHCKSLNCYHL